MRRLLLALPLAALATIWIEAEPARPAPQAAAPAAMLTVDSIMRGPKLVGSAPTQVRWSRDSTAVYFSWQRPDDERAATWAVNRDGTGLRQLSDDEVRALDVPRSGAFDRAHRRVLVVESGDIVMYDTSSGARRQLTRTTEAESSPEWARDDTAVTFVRNNNLFVMSLNGEGTAYQQITDIRAADDDAAAGRAGGPAAGRGGRGAAGGRGGDLTASQQFLRQQERDLIEYIRQLGERGRGGRGGGRGGRGGGPAGAPATPIARFDLGARQSVAALRLSGDGKHVWIGVVERPEQTARGQDTPNYVTESSYPEMISGRPNVGDVQPTRLLAALDVESGKSVWADASGFAGIEHKAAPTDPDVPRILNWANPVLSDDGSQTVMSVQSADNKDRWIVKVDPATGRATMLDHLHDEAWLRGSSIGWSYGGGQIVWLADDRRFVFLSESSGYLHLYALDATAAMPRAEVLTSGTWEVTSATLSKDRTTFFLETNEAHPGERHFYTMPVSGGARAKLTSRVGSHSVTVSPDEGAVAVMYSYSTTPPELYTMPLAAGATPVQVTTTPTDEWRSFKWIDPKVITYKARDGVEVYARLYTPEMIGARRDRNRPAVVFVHGAGYLQNAHKYWSTYYREYMFHNLLAARGYVVLDPDYRASSGYGRDWRTAIYRHMGGHDLNDVVDGAKFLVETERVNPQRIGVYGGSYGGFITLMALFTSPDTFAAGAALRPVTDWSHYNHGYTSNILNTPQTDSEAFKKSSPIYFAEGLTGRLLIAHGMVDTNVFFQDSVRLAQRLIELRKDNWELAGYPVESHGFTEETSWADEYRRILRMFEETLRPSR
ncbi:MAG TPA: S9 family peptidase [Vicinamibacterales bacterium]|nr:S9 family peptidase [Vicinamibacterales bacterium]